MDPPPLVQIVPRPEIDLAGSSKTFPPQTTRDIIRLMALQEDAKKDKNKRSAEDSPGFEIDNAISNANKSAKGKKNPEVAAPKTASRKKQNKIKCQSKTTSANKLCAAAEIMSACGDDAPTWR